MRPHVKPRETRQAVTGAAYVGILDAFMMWKCAALPMWKCVNMRDDENTRDEI